MRAAESGNEVEGNSGALEQGFGEGGKEGSHYSVYFRSTQD